MNDRNKPSAKRGRLPELERQAQEAKQRLTDAERRADETVEQAEQLSEKSKELGVAAEEILKKASAPVGFPPPPTKAKGKRT